MPDAPCLYFYIFLKHFTNTFLQNSLKDIITLGLTGAFLLEIIISSCTSRQRYSMIELK